MRKDNCELLLAIAQHLFRDDKDALSLIEGLLKSLMEGSTDDELE